MNLEFLNPYKDGTPFHPAVVHLPLGVSLVLPLLALLAAVAIWKGWVPKRTWWVIVLLQAMLAVGSFMAYQTGEHEKDLVGGIVDDAPVDAHEEAAQVFSVTVYATLAVSIAAGFAQASRLAPVAHLLVAALSLVIVFLGMRVGHLGGRLIYVHNAAQAHLPEATGSDGADADADGEKKSGGGEKTGDGDHDDD